IIMPQPAPLPRELVETIEDRRSWVRKGAVEELAQLLRGTHAGLALSAREALQKLRDEDDSFSVRRAAEEALSADVEADKRMETAPLPKPSPRPLVSSFTPSPVHPIAPSKTDELILHLAPNLTLELVRVPAGEFLMGSDDGDKDAYDDE